MTDAARELDRLLEVMARLRDPQGGCPWDREQDHASIAPYAIEEAYEVLDTIEKSDWEALPDELGDLLFQVVYQAQIARESERFDFATVAKLITDKMIRRHPHVFSESEMPEGSVPGRMTEAQWEAGKAQERKQRAEHGALAGVPRSLPALLRARKLAARAARVGFDCPDVAGVFAKVQEEVEELRVEIEAGDRAKMQDELGDLLFAVSSLARRLDIDPEASLRQANAKFTRRFEAVEAALAEEGLSPAGQPVEKLDALWRAVKSKEAGSAG